MSSYGWKIWENPIFRRYCQSRLRLGGLGVALLIAVLVSGFIFFMSRAIGLDRPPLSAADAERDALVPLLVFQSLILFVLGTALPLIQPGNLFPSREISRRVFDWRDWAPEAWQAVAMSGLYGFATLLLVFAVTHIITPSAELQIRGWRRARKEGRASLPVLSDAATAFGWVVIMALAGAGGWFVFTRALVESRWFPGHEVPLQTLGFFTVIMLSGGLGFHSLLEAQGGRVVGLAVIFVGIVPLMIGAVLSASNNRLIPAAAWLFGISPASAPVYASATLLSITELPADLARSVPRAFFFWHAVSVLVTVWLIVRLRRARKAIAEKAR